MFTENVCQMAHFCKYKEHTIYSEAILFQRVQQNMSFFDNSIALFLILPSCEIVPILKFLLELLVVELHDKPEARKKLSS